MADDDAEDSYTDDGPEAAAAAARPAPTSEPAPPRVPPLPPTITTSGPSDAKRAKKAAPAPAAAREDGGGPDAGELPDKGDDDWTPTEVAQFKKAMIVLGNKAWRDMTVYLPQRSHKALNRKYKDLGGSWGEVLKPHIREHRWLKKNNKLNERDVWLTEAELSLLKDGKEITFKFERPDKYFYPNRHRSHKVEDDDEGDDDDDDAPEKRPAKRGRLPLSDALKLMPADQADEFKRARVDEILADCVKGFFTHKSDVQVTKLRRHVPQPGGPRVAKIEIAFAVAVPESATALPRAKLSGLLSAKLLGATADASNKPCFSSGLSVAPLCTGAAALFDVMRAPTFIKTEGPPQGLIKGRKAVEARVVPVPEESSRPVAAETTKKTKRGVMKAGIARAAMKPSATADASARSVTKKAKTHDKSRLEDTVPEVDEKRPPVALLDEYVRRRVEPQVPDSHWARFRRVVALEQHVSGVMRHARSADEAHAAEAIRAVQLYAHTAEGEPLHSQVLAAACMHGGRVVRSLRVGAIPAGYRQLSVVTHWLTGTSASHTLTPLSRVKDTDSFCAALHAHGTLAAVAAGATISVFDLSQAGLSPEVSGSASIVSLHSETNVPLMLLQFSPHVVHKALLCAYDGEVLRVWRAWGVDKARKFITSFQVNALAVAPYMHSPNLLVSLRDPLVELVGGRASYNLVWHPRGDMFVTYSETVARVWRFRVSAPSEHIAPIFEHQALEGIVAVAFSPRPDSDLLVVLSHQQKVRFIDLRSPDDFAKVYTTLPSAPLTGFVFHPHQSDVLYGITPDGVPRLSALVLNSEAREEGGVLRAAWTLPDLPVNVLAKHAEPAPVVAGQLLPRERAILCMDESTICWFDALRPSFVNVRLNPLNEI